MMLLDFDLTFYLTPLPHAQTNPLQGKKACSPSTEQTPAIPKRKHHSSVQSALPRLVPKHPTYANPNDQLSQKLSSHGPDGEVFDAKQPLQPQADIVLKEVGLHPGVAGIPSDVPLANAFIAAAFDGCHVLMGVERLPVVVVNALFVQRDVIYSGRVRDVFQGQVVEKIQLEEGAEDLLPCHRVQAGLELDELQTDILQAGLVREEGFDEGVASDLDVVEVQSGEARSG
jgi:hypothetical protein